MKRNNLIALVCVAALAAVTSYPSLANTCPTLRAGATSQTINVTFIDNTTGLPASGLAFNSSGMDINYTRPGAAQTAVTEATQTAAGAWSSGGFVSNGQGTYRFDIPNAAIATGVPYVVVTGVATGYTMLPCTVQLTAVDLQDSVRAGMTALPNAAAEAAGGLYTRGSGAGQIAQDANGRISVNNVAFGGVAGTYSGGRPEVNTTHWAGTAVGSATVRADLINIGGAAVSTSTAQLGVNVVNFGGSAGTFASGRPEVKTQSITNGAITEASFDTTAGSFKPFGIVDQGTAQSASGTTLVLRSALAMGDDTANGMTLVACGSTQGYCQSRLVTDYVGSTDTATVDTWTVTPSGTITYYLLGTAPSSGSGSGLDAAGVRSALGMSSANLDTQLSTIAGYIDTEVGAIKTKTDFLPSATAGASGGVFIAGSNAATTVNFTGNLSGSVGSIGAGGITASSIATDAIGAAELASDAVTEIQSGLATSSALSTVAGYVDTEVAAIKSVTDKLDTALELDGSVYRYTTNALEQGPAGGGGGTNITQIEGVDATDQIDARIAAAALATAANLASLNTKIGTPAGASVSADIAAVKSDTAATLTDTGTTLDAKVDAIKAKTDSLTFTKAGEVDANVQSMNGATVLGDGTSGDKWRGE
jgi:hypothetical protein